LQKIIRYPLSVIRYPLSVIRYPLSVIRYPLSASRKRSADNYLKALTRRFSFNFNSQYFISAKNQLIYEFFYAGVSPPVVFPLCKNAVFMV